MAIKHFERGSSTYTCNVCARRTRNVHGEGANKLCAECYELAGIENEISDNGPLPTEDSRSPQNSWRTSVSQVRSLLDSLTKHDVDIEACWPEMVAAVKGGGSDV